MLDLKTCLSFGLEQTFTIASWWQDQSFVNVTRGEEKLKLMEELAKNMAKSLSGSYKESLDIWKYPQFEVFDQNNTPHCIVTMDPGSIEVKTPAMSLDNCIDVTSTLFQEAQRLGLKTYRQWWYGIKAGTEGGCHINMSGFEKTQSPFYLYPRLALSYFFFHHNRPWLHYPFMGRDVGPGGNAQRLDEISKMTLNKLYKKSQETKLEKPEDLIQLLHEFPVLHKEKSLFPAFRKIPDLWMIEDRAQEALRSENEVYHVLHLRYKIIEYLLKQGCPFEEPQTFVDLHTTFLSGPFLWEKFQEFSLEFHLNPLDYQVFFHRQFPTLCHHGTPPAYFDLLEGRRPRPILSEKYNDQGEVISKTVDADVLRFEVIFKSHLADDIHVSGASLEKIYPKLRCQGHLVWMNNGLEKEQCFMIDVKRQKSAPILRFEVLKNDQMIETQFFDLFQMKWLNQKEIN